MNNKNVVLVLFIILSIVIFYGALSVLVQYSWNNVIVNLFEDPVIINAITFEGSLCITAILYLPLLIILLFDLTGSVFNKKGV